MSPARRTARTSVIAAAVLIAIKLAVGLATNSLGFMAEAAHSGTDLAAALLTFFAIGVASRPADTTHGFGHGKAEHLSALAECAVLAMVSVLLAVVAIRRLGADAPAEVETTWWAFAVIGIVIAIDLTRLVISRRAAQEFGSAALAANALHFAGDLAGTIAVLVGLLLTRAGLPEADAFAALFVAALVLIAAIRMARVNVDVLMDHTPLEATATATRAIESLGPDIALKRLRMREAGGRQFADVVISIPPAAALAEGHLAADAVEAAIQRELPNADVVVHVEPGSLDEADIRERVLAAALAVSGTREIHNVRVFFHGAHADVALHLKLPSSHDVATAHNVATAVERSILAACPMIGHVTTHLEPLDDPISEASQVAVDARIAERITLTVREVTGHPPNTLRMTATPDGLVVFLAVAVDGSIALSDAHVLSGVVRRRLREQFDDLADVVVHTEPAGTTPVAG
jgi:cation diffusion facilitator family transporter